MSPGTYQNHPLLHQMRFLVFGLAVLAVYKYYWPKARADSFQAA